MPPPLELTHRVSHTHKSACLGVPAEVAANRDLMKVFLPAIRGDYTAIDNYAYSDGPLWATDLICDCVVLVCAMPPPPPAAAPSHARQPVRHAHRTDVIHDTRTRRVYHSAAPAHAPRGLCGPGRRPRAAPAHGGLAAVRGEPRPLLPRRFPRVAFLHQGPYVRMYVHAGCGRGRAAVVVPVFFVLFNEGVN